MKSTNINNPAPKIRKMVGDYPDDCHHLKARTYIDNTGDILTSH